MDSLGPSADEQKPGFVKRLFLIPCMKQSWLNGISGGLATGLGYFLFTSNVKKASRYGLGSMYLIVAGTWGYCRYNYHKAWEQKRLNEQKQKERHGAEDYKLIDPKDI